MTHFPSFQSIIDLWPSCRAMGADIGAPTSTVLKWSQRNNIPAEWWSAVLGTERAIGAGVTAEILTVLAAREVAEEARV